MTAVAESERVGMRWVLTEVDERLGAPATELPLLSVSIHHGVVPRNLGDTGQAASNDLSNYKRCWPGDIVVNRMRAFQGALGVADVAGVVSSDYAVLRPCGEPRYFHYLMRSDWFVGEMTSRLRGIGDPSAVQVRTPRINVRDLGEIDVPVPSQEVQHRIAVALDAESSRIDSLIVTNQRAADLAGERYRVLRRDLIAGGGALGDPVTASRLTEQGWRIAPLWMVSRNHDAKRVPLNAVERGAIPGPYPYWGANKVQDHINAWIFDQEMVLIGEDGAPYFVDDRDVAWVAGGRYWVNNHAHVVEAVDTSPRWLAECLNVVDYSLFVGGSTRDKLTQADLNAIPIPVASPEEEQDILNQLQREREPVDELVAKVSTNIALLRERKRAIITSAVTGQLDI